jgi:hypothetical protein
MRAPSARRDRLESRAVAFAEAEASKSFLTPIIAALARTGSVSDALDRAAAGFGDIDDDLRLQRLGRVALRQRDREIGVALGVGLHLVGNWLLDRGEFVVDQAADIAGIAASAEPSTACSRIAPVTSRPGGRRAIEELRVERETSIGSPGVAISRAGFS